MHVTCTTKPWQETVNLWQSLIELSPVWTDLPDVTTPLAVVASIHLRRSLNFPGVTSPGGWWLFLGINLPPWLPTGSSLLDCDSHWGGSPFLEGKRWPQILPFNFEMEFPEFSGAPDESVTACSQSCDIPFGKRQVDATPEVVAWDRSWVVSEFRSSEMKAALGVVLLFRSFNLRSVVRICLRRALEESSTPSKKNWRAHSKVHTWYF